MHLRTQVFAATWQSPLWSMANLYLAVAKVWVEGRRAGKETGKRPHDAVDEGGRMYDMECGRRSARLGERGCGLEEKVNRRYRKC